MKLHCVLNIWISLVKTLFSQAIIMQLFQIQAPFLDWWGKKKVFCDFLWAWKLQDCSLFQSEQFKLPSFFGIAPTVQNNPIVDFWRKLLYKQLLLSVNLSKSCSHNFLAIAVSWMTKPRWKYVQLLYHSVRCKYVLFMFLWETMNKAWATMSQAIHSKKKQQQIGKTGDDCIYVSVKATPSCSVVHPVAFLGQYVTRLKIIWVSSWSPVFCQTTFLLAFAEWAHYYLNWMWESLEFYALVKHWRHATQ